MLICLAIAIALITVIYVACFCLFCKNPKDAVVLEENKPVKDSVENSARSQVEHSVLIVEQHNSVPIVPIVDNE